MLGGLALQGTSAAADTVDRARYAARLGDARAALAQARAAPGATRSASLERARALLRETTALRLEDGTLVPVDDAALAARIEASDASIDRAAGDVAHLIAAALRGPSVDPAAADEALRRLVGEQRAAAGQATVVDTLARWVARALSGFGGAPPDPRIVVAVAGGLGLALLALVLGILGRDVRERFRREAVLPELAREERVEPSVHLRAAEDALREGRARDAVLALYAYAIATLAARETVRYDPSLTDRELLARARAIPHADALRELVDLHERISYGLRAAGPEDAERARALALRAVA